MSLAPGQYRDRILVPGSRPTNKLRHNVREVAQGAAKMLKDSSSYSVVCRLCVGLEICHEYENALVRATDLYRNSPAENRSQNWQSDSERPGNSSSTC